MTNSKKAGPVTLALALMIAGGILLAANFTAKGMPVSVITFWPVLLIGLGVEFFIRSYLAKARGDEAGARFHLPTVVIILLAAALGFIGQQAASLLKNPDLNSVISENIAGTAYSYKKDFTGGRAPYVKPGKTKVKLANLNGRVDLEPSTDGKLYVKARIIAWGPSEREAQKRAERVKINIDDGGA